MHDEDHTFMSIHDEDRTCEAVQERECMRMKMLVFLRSGGDANGTNFEVGVYHLAWRRVWNLAG